MDRTRGACGECEECIEFSRNSEPPVIPDHVFSQRVRRPIQVKPAPALEDPVPAPPRKRSREAKAFVLPPRQMKWCQDEALKKVVCTSSSACGTCGGCMAYDAGPPADLPESAFKK